MLLLRLVLVPLYHLAGDQKYESFLDGQNETMLQEVYTLLIISSEQYLGSLSGVFSLAAH